MFKGILASLFVLGSFCSAASPNYYDFIYGQVYNPQWNTEEGNFTYNIMTAEGRKYYAVDLAKAKKTVVTPPPAETKPQPKEAPRHAPKGQPQAEVKVGDLFVRDAQVFLKKEDKELQLSWDGNPTDSYRTPIIYSPDRRYALVMKKRDLNQRVISIVESSPKNQLQPITQKHTYVKPGDEIAVAYPMLFDLEQEKQIAIDYQDLDLPYALSSVRWDKDSKHFTFEYNVRGHQRYQVMAVEAATGKKRALIDEKTSTFIFYNKVWRHHLEDRKEILWVSERDGWKHLYLYDASKTDTVKKQITKGPWVMKEVLHVDEARETIYFLACGYYPEENPYYTHLFKVQFDGSGLTDLSPAKGNHAINLSPDKKYYLDTCSTVETEPTTALYQLEDASPVLQLEKADATPAEAKGWVRPVAFKAKGRDGKTDIYGNIYFPHGYDATQKYPVLEAIYAGPHDSHVDHAFHTYRGIIHKFTEKGYIVVSIDGMGTYNRSKAFHDVCWKNLKDAGFPDRIAWMKEAAKLYPCMDLSRVGIYGCSAGGQNAMGALLFHNDFYKVASASCGCHDNRMDKIWWNEQWMGYPIDESYAESSNVDQAHRLKGKLLLVVGELDTNVDPATTLQVANALIKANKYFELLVVPGVGHSYGLDYGERRTLEFFERNLKAKPLSFEEL